MIWILGSGNDIVVDAEQIKARSEYIHRVTGADVSAWQFISMNGTIAKRYLCCVSNDGVDGVFITAHIGCVFNLCTLRRVIESKIIIANTCIWERLAHKKLLWQLRSCNPTIELYFARQELSVEALRILRQSTTLLNVGQFGFQTSLSERELFQKRKQGVMAALKESFDRVSPILLLGE